MWGQRKVEQQERWCMNHVAGLLGLWEKDGTGWGSLRELEAAGPNGR